MTTLTTRLPHTQLQAQLSLLSDSTDCDALNILCTHQRSVAASDKEARFEMCGCRVQQKRDGNVEVDQTESARALQTIPITEHRRRQQRVVLSRHAHHQVITKRGVTGRLAQQTMLALTVLLSLIDAPEEAAGQALTVQNCSQTG